MTTEPTALRRALCLLALTICALSCHAAGSASADSTHRTDIQKYLPEIRGTIRTFFVQSTATGDSRFEVQMARVSANGTVMPWLGYFIQADLCAYGKMKILDAYVTLKPADGLRLSLGQSKAPFSTETARLPHTYLFANTAATFAAGNIRSAGLRVQYTLPKTTLSLEGGLYNNIDMSEHGKPNKSLLASARVHWQSRGGWHPSVGFMSRKPADTGGVRFNEADATLSWLRGGFFAEGEYIYRHYTGHAFADSHIYSILADYGFDIKARMADRLSAQMRFDGTTTYSNSILNSDGKLSTSIPSRRRLTAGITAKRSFGKVSCAFLLNFEQYFYGHSAHSASDADNALYAGLNVRF